MTRYTGVLTPQETAKSCLAYFAGAEFDPAHDHFFDLSGATSFDFDFGRMMRLVSRLEPHYARRDAATRSALFAPGDVGFGVGRMYQSLLADRVPFELGVFRNSDAALDFLGRDAETACAIWQELAEGTSVRAARPSSS